jgi:hypothetical protein
VGFRFATNKQYPPCSYSNRHPQSLRTQWAIHARVLPLNTVPHPWQLRPLAGYQTGKRLPVKPVDGTKRASVVDEPTQTDVISVRRWL